MGLSFHNIASHTQKNGILSYTAAKSLTLTQQFVPRATQNNEI
jgi:hypothetical protein